MPPKGGGEVIFVCPVKKAVKPVQFIDPGKIKRIRGVAYPLKEWSPEKAGSTMLIEKSIRYVLWVMWVCSLFVHRALCSMRIYWNDDKSSPDI